jgi:hypothetical protein
MTNVANSTANQYVGSAHVAANDVANTVANTVATGVVGSVVVAAAKITADKYADADNDVYLAALSVVTAVENVYKNFDGAVTNITGNNINKYVLKTSIVPYVNTPTPCKSTESSSTNTYLLNNIPVQNTQYNNSNNGYNNSNNGYTSLGKVDYLQEKGYSNIQSYSSDANYAPISTVPLTNSTKKYMRLDNSQLDPLYTYKRVPKYELMEDSNSPSPYLNSFHIK